MECLINGQNYKTNWTNSATVTNMWRRNSIPTHLHCELLRPRNKFIHIVLEGVL
jgi:hypothetical protein